MVLAEIITSPGIRSEFCGISCLNRVQTGVRLDMRGTEVRWFSNVPRPLAFWCPRWDSNPHCTDFEAVSSTNWDTGASQGDIEQLYHTGGTARHADRRWPPIHHWRTGGHLMRYAVTGHAGYALSRKRRRCARRSSRCGPADDRPARSSGRRSCRRWRPCPPHAAPCR